MSPSEQAYIKLRTRKSAKSAVKLLSHTTAYGLSYLHKTVAWYLDHPDEKRPLWAVQAISALELPR